jgi:hypothetical protein
MIDGLGLHWMIDAAAMMVIVHHPTSFVVPDSRFSLFSMNFFFSGTDSEPPM